MGVIAACHHPAPVVRPPAAFDTHTANLWSIGGLTLYISTWAGKLIRVIRTSDNVEQDIGPNAGDNGLNTTSLAAFVGASDAYITKVYDQTGGGNYFAPATGGLGPRIALAGVLDTELIFNSTATATTFFSKNKWPGGAGLSLAAKFSLRSHQGGSTADAIFFSDNLDVSGHIGYAWQYDPTRAQNICYLANSFGGGLYSYSLSNASALNTIASEGISLSAPGSSAGFFYSRDGSTLAFTFPFDHFGGVLTSEYICLGSDSISAPAEKSTMNLRGYAVYKTNLTQAALNTVTSLL